MAHTNRQSRDTCAGPAVSACATARSRAAALRLLLAGTLVLLTFAALGPLAVNAAQPPGGLTTGWTAQETDHYRFFVQTNSRLTAETFVTTYGAYAERAYDEISLFLNVTAPQKIQVYVYAETASFDAAMAASAAANGRREIDGIDAIADPQNLDISIALPRYLARSDLEAENQLRHATAHILAGVASGYNIPSGLDEGLAQYVERPNTPTLARIAAKVQTANQRHALISWFDLNRSNVPVDDPELSAAESYAVVAYLLEHQGIPEFQTLLATMKTIPGWRDAMKEVYAPTSVEDLEKQWRQKVSTWATSSEWRTPLIQGFDLDPAKELLAKGNYLAAQEMLELSERLFKDLDDQQRRDEVEDLKTQCAIGIQAEELMVDTQQALERHTYDRATTYLEKAKAQYDQLPPEQRPDELIATYEALAAAGTQAIAQLDAATGLSHNWGDYPEARQSARDAGETFATLGDDERRTQAQSILTSLDRHQRRLVLMLGALAVLTLAWLALWLWARGTSELQWD